MTEYSDLIFSRDSQTPGNYETLETLLYAFGKRIARDINVCTPAIVEEVYEDHSKASVRPLVKQPQSNGSASESLPIPVTVLQHQAGNFYVRTPLTKGDTGWLIASDWNTLYVKENNSYIAGEGAGEIGEVDSSGKVLTNAGPQPPSIAEMHVFTQGFFIPDKWGGIKVPEKFKDSFIIQQVSPDYSSHGRFILDKDGTIHILASKWQDKQDPLVLKGGVVDIDLRFKGIEPNTNYIYWNTGEIEAFAHSVIKGNAAIRSWTDEFKISHGGNLSVEKNAEVGGDISVTGDAHIEGEVQVDSQSLFKEKLVVKTDNKAAIINPKEDLHKTDAKFREVTVVTGFKQKSGTTVKLQARKMRVLSDEPENTKDVEFEVGGGGSGGGGGGGSDVFVDDKSIEWHGNQLSIKDWHEGNDSVSDKLTDIIVPDFALTDEQAEPPPYLNYAVLVRDNNNEIRYYKLGQQGVKLTSKSTGSEQDTTQDSEKAMRFTLESKDDSNIVITFANNADADGKKNIIQIGAYYL